MSASSDADEGATVAAAIAGEESAFAVLVERHRRELQVHCYRMLGSYQDAEDLAQETFLRAWDKRASFEGRSTFRAWLYRIATNACLDTLRRTPRRVRTVEPTLGPDARLGPPTEVAWLQPFPDRLLEEIAPSADDPDALVIAKETIELTFLAAIQHLSPHQRAILILRDVLGWPAADTASLLETTVAAANSSLQRARATLKHLLPERRAEWAAVAQPTADERALLQRYIDAHERADSGAVVELLRHDARISMPPEPTWYEGRDAVATFFEQILGPDNPGDWRLVPTRANRQPAAANYLRRWGDTEYRALTLDVLRIEDGVLIEITTFPPDLFPEFGLPPTL